MFKIRKNLKDENFFMIELQSSPKSTMTIMVSKGDMMQLKEEVNKLKLEE